jgi:hypothetical protein
MQPISAVVLKNTRVTVNCHIRNVDKAYLESNDTTLKLCFEDKTEIPSYTGDRYNISYAFVARLDNETFRCGLGNCVNLGSGLSSRISLVEEGKRVMVIQWKILSRRLLEHAIF